MLTKLGAILAPIGLLAGFTITWASQPTGGQVITVCPQGPPTCQFSRIQEAISAAADAAIIMIAPGTYREQGELKISKNVNLLGSEPRSVRMITDGVSVEGPMQVMISGLTIQGTIKVYEAQATLANVDVVGSIDVGPQGETEQPKRSRITLINVHVLGKGLGSVALYIGPAVEALVTASEFVADFFSGGIAVVDAQLVISHSLIKGVGNADGLLASGKAKVWLSDTQVEIYALPRPPNEWKGPVGIVAYEGSDLALQRVKIFSTNHGILIENMARLRMEASQVVAINGWGISLVIEPCGVRLPPTADPSPQTFEGLVTGRQNEITGSSDRGDVCPSALEFLKTAEGGQYP